MLQNTGAVISIAFVLAIVTAAVPKPVLFKISPDWRRVSRPPSSIRSSPTCTSHCGCSQASQCSARACRCCDRRTARGRVRMIRIGEVAERVGTTPRTIRYYEEIGLLPGGQRRKGSHRVYDDDDDVERLLELKRLRDL